MLLGWSKPTLDEVDYIADYVNTAENSVDRKDDTYVWGKGGWMTPCLAKTAYGIKQSYIHGCRDFMITTMIISQN